MPAYGTGKCVPNVEIDGSRRNIRRVVVGRFRDDPIASSILYAMRDPDGGMRKVKANDVKGLENESPYAEHLLPMCKNQAATRPSTSISVGGQGADNAAKETTAGEKRGSKAAYSRRYKDAMDALLKPVSSYTLLYEPHLVPASKIPHKKKKPTQKSVPQSKPGTKKKLQLESFPQNVRTLTATGMLDGAAVQYLSASREKELRGIIKGPSYFCGCKSCNYSKAVNAYEFESHAGCKTSHPNNHIHLQNGKALHLVVQELKNTPSTSLCDAIQTVIGPSLNREAFCSWKESFEAASHKL